MSPGESIDGRHRKGELRDGSRIEDGEVYSEALYLSTCRDCGTSFWLALKPTGSKWTSLCGYCLRSEL